MEKRNWDVTYFGLTFTLVRQARKRATASSALSELQLRNAGSILEDTGVRVSPQRPSTVFMEGDNVVLELAGHAALAVLEEVAADGNSEVANIRCDVSRQGAFRSVSY
jgi:hypothetical protein